MTGLTAKERSALAFLYELNEFKAFKKLCQVKRDKVAEMIISQDMSISGSDKIISFLQGQAYALEYISKELQSIHKKEINIAIKEAKR